MKLVTVATALLVLGASGLVGATTSSGSRVQEEVRDVALDFTEAGGEPYYLKCDNGARLMKNCIGAVVYQETNGLAGLQTTPQRLDGILFPADSLIS